jgi:hypothetical protein
MLRRDFLCLMAVAAPAAGIGRRALLAQSGGTPWRTYEVTTSIQVLKPSGRTRIWLPQPLPERTSFQRVLSSEMHCEGGKTSIHEDLRVGFKILADSARSRRQKRSLALRHGLFFNGWPHLLRKRQTKCMDDVFAAQAAGVRSAMR